MTMASLKPILTKQDQVVEHIRERIIAGEYDRGEQLKQADIAEQLGVSITPVREALKALEMEGYVVSMPNRGIYIPRYTEKDVTQIFELRLMLERFLMTKALLKIQPRDVAELKAIHQQFLYFLNEKNYLGMRISNVRFHFTLYELADHAQTLQFVRVLWAKYPFNFQDRGDIDRFNAIYAEHQRILDMLDADDKDGVITHFMDHLTAGRNRLDDPPAGL